MKRRLASVIACLSFSSITAPLLADPAASAPTDFRASAEGRSLIEVWKREGHRFTPPVKAAWLGFAKASALRELRTAGVALPGDFLDWIDADPMVAATVYGARKNPVDVLRMLRSLEIDLGKEVVRREYTQFALAMAVVHADKGPQADLKERPLLKIVIPGDPRVAVDTKDPKRKPDRDDHIIKFLDSHTIEEDVVIGQKEEVPPLKYDDRGIAIPPPKNAKPVKVPF